MSLSFAISISRLEVVAFESVRDDHGNILGRAIAESNFHHFVDYKL